MEATSPRIDSATDRPDCDRLRLKNNTGADSKRCPRPGSPLIQSRDQRHQICQLSRNYILESSKLTEPPSKVQISILPRRFSRHHVEMERCSRAIGRGSIRTPNRPAPHSGYFAKLHGRNSIDRAGTIFRSPFTPHAGRTFVCEIWRSRSSLLSWLAAADRGAFTHR